MSDPSPEAVRLDICPYGDMEIVITTPSIDVTYLVSSIQLRSGSTYFRSMLGPHFAEGGRLRSTTPNSRDPVLQVTAEDEFDPTALATVLYVLHAKPQYIPRTVTSENLLDIAIVCNYYDCAPAMRPWDDFWIKSASSVYQQPGYEYWLFISWVFGKSNIFEKLTKTFLRKSVIEDGEFGVMVEEKLVRMDPHLPQPIIAAMADWRTKIGEEFTSECNNLYKQYYEDTPIKCLQRQTHCDNLVFAAIHKCFVSRNLINADAKLQVHLTLDSLLQDFQITINEISKRGIFSVNIEGGVHYHCNTLNNTVRALQSKLNNIQPLHLRGYSGHYSGREYKDTWDDIFFNAGGPDSPWYKHQCHALQCLHFIICPDGDMDVVLRTNTVEATYRVCSHQLRASSSVFRNSISPARVRAVQELGGGHRFRIALKVAHDTTALAVVFFVVHASVTRLPDIIPFAGLVVIAAVCNYYNCAAALAPWDGMWISQLNYANSRSCSLEYHDLLFVAWVFGQEQIFGDLTKLFAQKVFIKDLGIVVSVTDDMKDVQNFHHSLPQAVIASMIEQRTKADKAIVKACAEIYQKYESDVSAKCQNQQCDHSVFAELHMGFKKAGLLAKEFNHNIPPDVSISMVARDITKLFNKTATIVQYCNSGSGFHSECHNYTSMSDEAKKVEDILESFNPLRLASFGKSAVEEPTTTWGSVLANGGN